MLIKRGKVYVFASTLIGLIFVLVAVAGCKRYLGGEVDERGFHKQPASVSRRMTPTQGGADDSHYRGPTTNLDSRYMKAGRTNSIEAGPQQLGTGGGPPSTEFKVSRGR